MRRINSRKARAKLGIQSRETERKMQSLPGFPQPVYDDGSPVKYYIEEEVDAYIARQVEARDLRRKADVEGRNSERQNRQQAMEPQK